MKKRISRLRLAVAFGAVAVIAAVATVSAWGGSRPAAASTATLTVSGSGSVTYTPDIATLSFSASSRRKTAVAATAANATLMNAVLAALQGADAQKISTNQVSIAPAYAPGSGDLVGFTASNSVQASTSVDRVGALIDTAIAAGATSVQGATFSSSKDPSALYRTALRTAVAQAKAQAQVLADDAAVTLGPLVSITPGSSAPIVTATPTSASPPSTPVVPATQSVSASVTLVFGIS
ncbi:MAG TPA: SIMPL domain-containing protein [Gaiellaceae bacterium]|nr:SIMPL domain-containing protein [Gaiellaceae bacterium]